MANEKLGPEVVKDLRAYWVPQLREIRQRRQFMIRLMVFLLFVPILFSAALAGYLIYEAVANENVLIELAAILLLILGVPAFSFVYIGKLQQCNDSLVQIELFVHLRDRLGLINALSKIECLGGLKEILDDAGRIIGLAK